MLNAAVHRLVERHAAIRGDEIALIDGSGTLTYRELNQRANALARHLIETGLRRGSHVVVRMDRSPELAIVLLAVLKAGAAYSWFDRFDECEWPEGVTIAGVADDGAPTQRVIDLQELLDRSGYMHPNLPILTRGSDIACVLPGRDGLPAVMVPHATITSLRSHPVPQPARWSMEPAALDLWLPLMAGATVTLSKPDRDTAAAA
jgi:non-ribosomal peptide synthetase component F